MSDIRQELLGAFAIEHKEHTDGMRAAAAALRAGVPVDVARILRHAHSLKGAARAVDMPDVEAIAHHLESLFVGVESGGRALGGDAPAVIDMVLDAIESYVAASLRETPPPALDTAAAALADLLRGSTKRPPAGEVAAETEVEAAPEAATAAKAGDEGPLAIDYLRVSAGQVERLSEAMHDLSREIQEQDLRSATVRKLVADSRTLIAAWDVVRPRIAPEGEAGGDAGDVTFRPRLAAFEENLRGLVRNLSALGRSHIHTTWTMEQAGRRLREDIDQITLLSCEAVFGDFGRMVRTIARDQGKTVDFQITGLETQAERQVLQRLREPIIHVLRNAVSHGGAETAAERTARGKPPALEIRLAISSASGQLHISVTDDGPGPDPAGIRKTAVARGLLAPLAAGHVEDADERRDLLDMVFAPGFSTLSAVDTISGRGVGLSAVAEAVRAARGSVRFLQATSGGAEIRLTAPLSASRQSLLFVEVAGATYGIPVHGVDRLIQARLEDLMTVEGQLSLPLDVEGRQTVALVASLQALLGVSGPDSEAASPLANIIILQDGEDRLAVAVDRLMSVQTAVVGPPSAVGADLSLITGDLVLGGDVPALVLNPAGLFAAWRRQGAAGRAAPKRVKAPAETRSRTTILVVDDSITTRTLERSILEAQGYRVILSVDGIDALTALRTEGAMVDVVVADVEMPRLDGFGLLQAMKNDPRLAAIPVILVTSRDDPEHVRRGLELGAGAYLTKQRFDQRELLSTIGQFL